MTLDLIFYPLDAIVVSHSNILVSNQHTAVSFVSVEISNNHILKSRQHVVVSSNFVEISS